MDFSKALLKIKQGYCLNRVAWGNADQVIRQDEYNGSPIILLIYTSDVGQPRGRTYWYYFPHSDIFAMDWRVV